MRCGMAQVTEPSETKGSRGRVPRAFATQLDWPCRPNWAKATELGARDAPELGRPLSISRKNGRDLRKLNRRTLEPLHERPHMIRQFCHHGWCSILTRFRLQCPHRPAE